MGGRSRDADTKRSADIAKPDYGDAANLEAEGNKGAVFFAAEDSAGATYNK